MLPTTAAILLVFLGSLWAFIHLWGRKTSSSPSKHDENAKGLPPGPYPLPIIGNLHLLGNKPHRSFQKLAQKHGPIMSIRLGSVPFIVVSSPYYAEQFLKTQGIIFASRPKVLASDYMSYGTKGIGFTPYGPYLRNMRKLCTFELLTASKIESFEPIRKEEIGAKVESVKRYAAAGEAVDALTMLTDLIEDMTCRMIFGKCKDDRFDLKVVIHQYMRMAGAFNISDYLPWLRPFDLQGLNRRMKATSMLFDDIMEAIISDHEQDKSERQRNHNYFGGMLLSLMNDHRNSTGEDSYTIDRTTVKAIMLDMAAASVDTIGIMIQWIFLNLMKHPRVMKKLQAELETAVGLGRMVQETDLSNALYLDMVIKESLRLYPVAPLLIPHESMEETTVNGYLIPNKSRLFVNIWAIGRDPNVWSDNADDFYPERFEGSNVDYRSQHFKVLAFGYGRRGCLGMQFGLTMMSIVIAQFVHCFKWELPNGMLPHEVDMTEKFVLAIIPANRLFAVPTYRLHE